ncbi:uncharacterized protein TNCT_200311 [Trichonephila clavata]|uniref:Uncharacterized protein n=1 Tax=Trichonephila clavata TaxID=2740835 RepID=A0A8X6HB00_TRICU|nr:uncharacterized protein TNCT_200311 [Trichonephila clavata]
MAFYEKSEVNVHVSSHRDSNEEIPLFNVPMGIYLRLHSKQNNKFIQRFMRRFSYCASVTFHLFTAYMFIALAVHVYYHRHFRSGFFYLFINISVIVLWYSMLFQRRKTKDLLIFLESHAQISGKFLMKSHLVLSNLIFFIMCVLPTLLAIFYVYRVHESKRTVTFWMLNYEFQEKKYLVFGAFVGGFVYYIINMAYPFLFTVSICILIHRYGLLLLQFNNVLKTADFSVMSIKCVDIINDYTRIEKKIRLLSEVFSVPLFVMLMISFFDLYIAMFLYLRTNSPFVNWPEIFLNALTSLVILFSLTLFGSKIPEYMLQIQKTAKLLINKCDVSRSEGVKQLYLLRRILKNDVIYLSVGGMVDLKKSLLLSAAGTFFTYGLLLQWRST